MWILFHFMICLVIIKGLELCAMDFIYYDLSSKWTEIAGIRIYIKFRLASV